MLLPEQSLDEGGDGSKGTTGATGSRYVFTQDSPDCAGRGVRPARSPLQALSGYESEVDGLELGTPPLPRQQVPSERAPADQSVSGTQKPMPVGNHTINRASVE